MNDPIKKFVQHHREAFDHLEPPDGVLQRLRGQLVPAPVAGKPLFRRYGGAPWLVAASLLVGILVAYLMFGERNELRPGDGEVAVRPHTPQVTDAVTAMIPDSNEQSNNPAITHGQPARSAAPNRVAATKRPVVIPRPLADRLADSSSASTRLAAILEIEESGRMDHEILDMLARSLHTDGNTNVRLAALDILSHHIDNQEVANLFANSLTSQDDPLVQLGIVKVAARIDDIAVEDALFALARDPRTFLPVKDEAYAILLHRDRL